MSDKPITTPEDKLYDELKAIIFIGHQDSRKDATDKIKRLLDAEWARGYQEAVNEKN